MKQTSDKLISYIILIIGVLATMMLFFPGLSFSDSETSFLGYEVVFGTDFVNLGSFASGQIVMSFLGILAYLLPVAAGLLVVLNKKGTIISAVLFLVGAVLLFTLPDFTKTTVTILGTVTEIDVEWVMGYGLVIAAILSSLGLIACVIKISNNK